MTDDVYLLTPNLVARKPSRTVTIEGTIVGVQFQLHSGWLYHPVDGHVVSSMSPRPRTPGAQARLSSYLDLRDARNGACRYRIFATFEVAECGKSRKKGSLAHGASHYRASTERAVAVVLKCLSLRRDCALAFLSECLSCVPRQPFQPVERNVALRCSTEDPATLMSEQHGALLFPCYKLVDRLFVC